VPARSLERGRTQALARRHAQLLGDEVAARHELRDGMLDLDPPVQLEEEEVAAVEHELGRTGAAVADRGGEGDRSLAHRRPQLRIEGGGG
jgi:hypothetical protein